MSTYNFNDKVINKNKGNVHIGDVYINTKDLRNELKNLSDDLKQAGYNDDSKYIKDIKRTIKEMGEVINNTPENQDIEDILREKGIISKIKNFYNDITDEDSDLYKKTAKLRNGAKTFQKILNIYNEVAKPFPLLPKIPDVFLGK
jgi:polyhydroxyalkanoate synthesis regulator phasin